MNRLGLMAPSELEGETKDLYEAFHILVEKSFGLKPNATISILDSEERLLGPLGVLLHTPTLGQAFLAFMSALGDLPNLSRPHREIAILAVGSKFDAGYEVYAHAILAQKAGLSAAQIAQIKAGEKPATLLLDDEGGSAVYDVAWELVNVPGPLKESVWERAVGLIGKEGTTAVVHYVGIYSYVSMLLRGFDCKVPEGKT